MAVTIPPVASLAPAPQYTEPSQIVYWQSSQVFDDSLASFQPTMNASIAKINEAGVAIEGEVTLAEEQVTLAEEQVTLATEQADLAEQYAEDAKSYINYKGVWVANYLGIGYKVGEGVSYPLSTSMGTYISNTDNNVTEPTLEESTTEWKYLVSVPLPIETELSTTDETSIDYNTNQDIIQSNYVTGNKTSYIYDATSGNLIQQVIKDTDGTTTILTIDYTYDANGNYITSTRS